MPIVDVHLWYDRPVLGCDFAALLDSPVQWVFEKSPGYVCCSLSAADELVQRPERELVDLGRSELAAVLPQAARARLLSGAATRDPEATFIPAPDVRRPGPATALSNLVIAGAWTDTGWPATIEFGGAQRTDCCAHALQQCRRVAVRRARGSRARRWRWRMQSEALRSAVDWLLEHQDTAGWWSGELETNVTMTAEHVLLLRFLGVPHDDIRDGAIRHILGAQRADGTWANYHDGPGDLSTTIEAYVALRVLGVDATQPQLGKALRMILDQGGLVEARVFTKIWLALFGIYPWDGVPSMPPELVRLPSWAPLNLYDFACWARGTIAPLLIVISTVRCATSESMSTKSLPPGANSGCDAFRVPACSSGSTTHSSSTSGCRVSRDARHRATRLVEWITQRQEADGGWGGIQPPWVYSLIALNLEGMSLDHAVIAAASTDSDDSASTTRTGGVFRRACRQLGHGMGGARAAQGRVAREHPALRRAVDWLLAEQIAGGGDWQVKVPLETSGGWAFEFDNDVYPDIDDTAVVVLALLESGDPALVSKPVAEAVRWCRAMRSRNGAWGAFDKDNTRALVYKLPFADFGAMLDPPSEDVTAHVIEMLAAAGCGLTTSTYRRHWHICARHSVHGGRGTAGGA